MASSRASSRPRERTQVSTPGYVFRKKERQSLIRKDTCTLTLMVALFIICKLRAQPKCPPREDWIRKV